MFTPNNISKFLQNISDTDFDEIKYFIHEMFKAFLYVEHETDCLYQWDVKEKIHTFSQEMTVPPSYSWNTETRLFSHNETGDGTLKYIRDTLEPFRKALKKRMPSPEEEDVYSYIMTRNIERDIIKNCSEENVPLFNNTSGEIALGDDLVLSLQDMETRSRTYRDLYTYNI